MSGFLVGSMKCRTVPNSGACSKVSTATLQQPRSLSVNLHIPFFRDKDFKEREGQGFKRLASRGAEMAESMLTQGILPKVQASASSDELPSPPVVQVIGARARSSRIGSSRA